MLISRSLQSLAPDQSTMIIQRRTQAKKFTKTHYYAKRLSLFAYDEKGL